MKKVEDSNLRNMNRNITRILLYFISSEKTINEYNCFQFRVLPSSLPILNIYDLTSLMIADRGIQPHSPNQHGNYQLLS